MALADLGDGAVVPWAWWSPRDATKITYNGSNEVSALLNKGAWGASGNLAQATTAKKPIYVASSNVNSKPAIRTNNTTQVFLLTYAFAGIGGNISSNNATTNWRVAIGGVDRVFTTGFDMAAAGGGVSVVCWDATSVRHYFNGTLVETIAVGQATQGTIFDVKCLSGPGAAGGFGRLWSAGALLNDSGASGTRGMEGDLCDWGYYTTALGSTDREFLEGVLAWANGTEAKLPGGHTYASAAPTTGTTHALVKADFTTGSPAFGATALGQTHLLSKSNMTTGAPALAATALGQTHLLSKANMTTTAPVHGATALGQTHTLVKANMTTGAPVLDATPLGYAGSGGPGLLKRNFGIKIGINL